jgi:cephalosporin-C deacetylase-like acetyl esterase
MAPTSFDRFFLNLPPFDRADDFDQFWNKSISDAKKIPLEPLFKENKTKSDRHYQVYDASFTSFAKTRIKGHLYLPNGIKKPRVIISIHDYNRTSNIEGIISETGPAYFFPVMRGHDTIPVYEVGEEKSPGFMVENILDRDTYYVKSLYLDIYRALDMLRLLSSVDCGSIGIHGKGLGAAIALFAAANSNRITALALDTPSFCSISESQNLSTSDAAIEINSFIAMRKNRKKQVKETLSYFDAVNFSDRSSCPVMATIGLKDTISPPSSVFGLFNHLLCEKTIEVYPEGDNTAGGEEQLKKLISWLIKQIGV